MSGNPRGHLALYPVEKTMDSREIAELCEKRHDNVCRDIVDQLSGQPGGILRFEDTYTNQQNGQVYRCYKLPYRETMILVSGYCVDLRAKVIDRWMELETEAAARLPKSFAEALRLAADQQEKIERQQAALAIAEPKAILADNFLRSDRHMSITDAGKHIGLKQGETFNALRLGGYITVDNKPTSKALDHNVLHIVEVQFGTDQEGRPKYKSQTVIKANQVENFRAAVMKYHGQAQV